MVLQVVVARVVAPVIDQVVAPVVDRVVAPVVDQVASMVVQEGNTSHHTFVVGIVAASLALAAVLPAFEAEHCQAAVPAGPVGLEDSLPGRVGAVLDLLAVVVVAVVAPLEVGNCPSRGLVGAFGVAGDSSLEVVLVGLE